MQRYIIEKDLILEAYIVWELHNNYRIECYRGTKQNCESYMKKKEKKNGNKRRNA